MYRSARMAAICAAAMFGAACGSSPAAPPVVTSLAPTTGTVGTVVSIAGSGFTSGSSVTFSRSGGGSPAAGSVQSSAATALDVQVPQVATADAQDGTVYDVTVSNPGGGSVTFPNAFTMKAPTVADINGGLSGSGTVNSLFIIDGQNFGDLSAAPSGGYSVDFRNGATGSVIASASVNFASSDWQDIFIVGTVPASLSASTTYKVTVTTPSGTSTAVDFLVSGSVTFSPSTITWGATSSLPVAQGGFGAVLAPVGSATFIYALGGNTAQSSDANAKAANADTVYMNRMDSGTGVLANASWASLTPLPAKRGYAAAVSANGFNSLVSGNGNLYLLGGLDDTGAATSTVYYASLNSDGTLPAGGAAGSWTETTPLPQPLFAAGAAIFHGRIYVAGGNGSTGTPVAKVYSSKINADGTLGAWQTLPDLPAALAYHQLVTAGGSLYVLGGSTATVDPTSNTQSAGTQSAIYRQAINIRNGGLASTTWTTNASALGKTREKFSAVAAGSYLLVSGGLYSGASTGSSEQSYAAISADGSIGSFNGATGVHTIVNTSGYDFFNHSAVMFVDSTGTPHVLVLGGQNVSGGVPESGVWLQN